MANDSRARKKWEAEPPPATRRAFQFVAVATDTWVAKVPNPRKKQPANAVRHPVVLGSAGLTVTAVTKQGVPNVVTDWEITATGTRPGPVLFNIYDIWKQGTRCRLVASVLLVP